jgi:hypothetical protein
MTCITTSSTPACAGASSGSPSSNSALLEDAEQALFGDLLDGVAEPAEAPAVFILGSPRTGSTPFYQMVVKHFRLPYPCNLCNDAFAEQPIVSGPLLAQVLDRIDIAVTSAYGKTRGAFQPSEGSLLMRHWFGGEHPAQTRSNKLLPGKREHFQKTIAAVHRLFTAPVVIKNAWNCFRIADIARQLPRAYFLWIRRDIGKSALSDLAARYTVQGDPNCWNSATPARVEELRRLPYVAQVVENQYEFSRAIRAGLETSAAGRWADVWYEDLLADPDKVLRRLGDQMRAVLPSWESRPVSLGKKDRAQRDLRTGDEERLQHYIAEHRERFAPLCRAA